MSKASLKGHRMGLSAIRSPCWSTSRIFRSS